MAKRSLSEVVGEPTEAIAPEPKRPRQEQDKSDALALLLENADELIECLQGLKAEKAKQSKETFGPGDLDPTVKENLATLGKKLGPALVAVGSVRSSRRPAKQEPSLQIPSQVAVTKWTVADLEKQYPPLPTVLNPALEIAALTHSGKAQGVGALSYERLEWIGDIYLELIASSFIYQTFPHLAPGKCSQYREMLVRNATLSEFSVHYGLDKRANFPDEFGLGGRPGGTTAGHKQRLKVLGDIFEAYSGAIILSDPQNGIQRCSEWLKVLWGKTLEQHIRAEDGQVRQTNQAISPKTQLEVTIGVPGVKLEYRDMPSNGKKERDTNLPLFTVGCYLTGWGETDKQLGWGHALSKKEAGQRAAQMALENKALIKKYAEKRKSFLAARAAHAAQAERGAEGS